MARRIINPQRRPKISVIRGANEVPAAPHNGPQRDGLHVMLGTYAHESRSIRGAPSAYHLGIYPTSFESSVSHCMWDGQYLNSIKIGFHLSSGWRSWAIEQTNRSWKGAHQPSLGASWYTTTIHVSSCDLGPWLFPPYDQPPGGLGWRNQAWATC